MLYYKSKLDDIRSRTYEGKTTYWLQFIEKLPEGGINLRDIKVPEGMNVSQFQIGKLVEVPVLLSTVEGTIYYRIAEVKTGMSGKPEE